MIDINNLAVRKYDWKRWSACVLPGLA